MAAVVTRPSVGQAIAASAMRELAFLRGSPWDLALATWQGSIGGELTVKVDSKDLANTVLDIDIKDHCDFLTVPAMADLRRFEQPL